MTLSNGIWISHSSGDSYIKWLVRGEEAVVLSSKNSGWMKGARTSNDKWPNLWRYNHLSIKSYYERIK